jgi:MFS family permease
MTAIDVTASGLSADEHSRQLRRALIASTVGTTIEWYDFLLYGQVTGLVFGKLFFPHSDPIVGVLQAFAIFFVGFLGRPIGAAIFGHWGDRIGRKATLIATLLLTGIATFAVGLVPTYATKTAPAPASRSCRNRSRGCHCSPQENHGAPQV